MPLHRDDPKRAGNLTDAEYKSATEQMIAAVGDAGLHTVPDEILDAAIERAKARHGQ
jgi:hypothetical protein